MTWNSKYGWWTPGVGKDVVCTSVMVVELKGSSLIILLIPFQRLKQKNFSSERLLWVLITKKTKPLKFDKVV